MENRDRSQDWVLLAVGIVIVVAGAWILLGRLPILEPVRIALDLIRRISLPLILVAGGVLLILYATRRDLFTRPDGRRLYRSRTHRAISGVLGGVAEYFGWDVALVRILYVVIAFITGFGPLILAYIIASIAIPEAPPAEVVPPAWPTTEVYTPPPNPPQAPAPPQPYYPPTPSTPPAPSPPPTAPSVPEIPAPGTPVPPGQAYPPQAAVPAVPAEPPAAPEVPEAPTPPEPPGPPAEETTTPSANA
jgi:phage shock protein PspC (stress-responsive transcriptional regulator)